MPRGGEVGGIEANRRPAAGSKRINQIHCKNPYRISPMFSRFVLKYSICF